MEVLTLDKSRKMTTVKGVESLRKIKREYNTDLGNKLTIRLLDRRREEIWVKLLE